MTKTSGWWRVGAAAVVAAVLLAGCTSGGDTDTTGPDSDNKGGQDGAALVAPLVDLTETIGEPVEFQVAGSSKDTVTVGVLGLEIDGEIQILHLALTPHFASKPNDASISLFGMLGDSSFSPKLVDRSNLKVYSSVDSSSDIFTKGTNGQPMYAYAVFAAPQDEGAVDFDLRINSWVPITVKAEEK